MLGVYGTKGVAPNKKAFWRGGILISEKKKKRKEEYNHFFAISHAKSLRCLAREIFVLWRYPFKSVPPCYSKTLDEVISAIIKIYNKRALAS